MAKTYTNDSSILTDIKKLLSITQDNTEFDKDIVFHINTAFANLRQMGVGPKDGFRITGEDEKWTDYYDDKDFTDNIKDYIYINVRLVFDTPQASGMKDALEYQLDEIAYRIRLQWDDEMSNE